MRVRKKLMIAAVSLAVAALGFALLTREREPEYQGRPLSYWVDVYRNYYSIRSDPASVELANQAIRTIGTNALPYLLKWLEYDSSKSWLTLLYSRMPQSVRKVDFLARKMYLGARRSGYAAMALAALGPDAKPAIPELTRIMNSTNSFTLSSRAAKILACIGKDAVPTLVAAATNRKNPLQTRVEIIFTLPNLGTNSYLAVPALIQLISDPNPEIAGSAAAAIIEMGGRYVTNAPAQ